MPRNTPSSRFAHARAHLAAEAALDLDGTMASMQEPYFYEVWPTGLRMEGRSNAVAYYRFHFATLRPRMVGANFIGEWENEEGLVIERDVFVRDEEGQGTRTYRVLAILATGSDGVAGERIYAHPDFHRLIFGGLLEDRFHPIGPPD